MAICSIGGGESLLQILNSFQPFADYEIKSVNFPITASQLKIDMLIVAPKAAHLERLAATISDWNRPPVSLFILEDQDYEAQVERLEHHPRVGRAIFFCRNSRQAIETGLTKVLKFYLKRKELNLENNSSEKFALNNVSPRWLFNSLMQHLDEYIYFKDRDSRFLAVSQYLIDKCGKSKPEEVLGQRDFDFFDSEHAQCAYRDEREIVEGKLDEIYKNEPFLKGDQLRWVASRKLPLYTRSRFLAGTFGISRDITAEKTLNDQLAENNKRMQNELLLARNLQGTLMKQNLPQFLNNAGQDSLQIATQYIPSFHLSGDLFSIRKTPEGNASILLGDVMGHGVRAAMVTAMIQIAVQELEAYADQPAVFMEKLNAILNHIMQPAGETMFATAVYCHLDIPSKTITYVQAGAKHGVFAPAGQANAASLFDKENIAPALGLLPSAKFNESSIGLQTGDEILLYTDGIVEAAMNDEEYSEQRLLDFLVSHQRDELPDMMNQLVRSVQDFTQCKELEDDVCLVGLRIL